MGADRIHHPCSPSALQVYEASPCFLPRNTDSEAGLAGTLQHDAAESRDFSKLNDEQAEAVQEVCDYVDNIVAQFPGATLLNEQYLPVDDIELFPGFIGSTAGYLDFGLVSADGELAHVVDYKFGVWSVEPSETNLQGHAYLLGLLKRYPKLRRGVIHFLQPYLDTADVASFDAAELQRLYLRVRTVAERKKQWDKDYSSALTCKGTMPKFYPTTGSCIFCARIGSCQANAEMALKIGRKFLPLQVPESVEPSLAYDPDKQRDLIKLADVQALWSKAIRSQITDEALRAGVPPTDYRFVQSTRPSVKDAEYVRTKAAELGVPAEVIKEATSVTLGPLEKAIMDISPRGYKKANAEAFRDDLEQKGAVVQGDPFTSLRMIADKATDES